MKWFKHDSDANMDSKLQEVLLDYGLEGYGLYWYCLELIARNVDKNNITFELEHDARLIARNTGSSVQKVQEMMTRFVSVGLFEESLGRITCLKLSSRTDEYTQQLMRNAISSTEKLPRNSLESTDKLPAIRIEENRLEQNRTENKYSPPIPADLLKEWMQHRKKKPVTERVIKTIELEANKLGWTLTQAIECCCSNSWQGFKAEWVNKDAGNDKYSGAMTAFGSLLNRYAVKEIGNE